MFSCSPLVASVASETIPSSSFNSPMPHCSYQKNKHRHLLTARQRASEALEETKLLLSKLFLSYSYIWKLYLFGGELSILLKRKQYNWDWHFKNVSIQWLLPSCQISEGQCCTWEWANKNWNLRICLQALQDATCRVEGEMYWCESLGVRVLSCERQSAQALILTETKHEKTS